MTVLNTEVYFIVAGYNFESTEHFNTVYSNSESCKEIATEFKKQSAELKVNGILLPPNIPAPLITYKNKSNEEIIFNSINKRLDIRSKDFKEEKIEFFSKILKDLTSFKLQEVSNVGVNFLVHYNTGNKKLNIFNANIHKTIQDFPKNVGFQVTLEFDLSKDFNNDCLATYDITKIQGGDNTDKDYIYVVAANYNFPLKADKASPIERFKELESITNQIGDVYIKFKQTYDEIFKL